MLFGILVGEELDRRDEAAIADMDVVVLVVVEEGVGQGRTRTVRRSAAWVVLWC